MTHAVITKRFSLGSDGKASSTSCFTHLKLYKRPMRLLQECRMDAVEPGRKGCWKTPACPFTFELQICIDFPL